MMRPGRLMVACAILFAVTCEVEGAVIHVAPEAGPGVDYTSVQEAVDAARAGDVVLVAPGTYVLTEPLDFNRLHDPEDPESEPARDIEVSSEGGPADTILTIVTDPADAAPYPRRKSVVVFEKGETDASVLEGFTITGGRGTRDTVHGSTMGGGVLIRGASSPTLRNCTIVSNLAEIRPGSRGLGNAVYCGKEVTPRLEECRLVDNAGTDALGAALYCDGAHPTALRTTISGNAVGVYLDASAAVFDECVITRNRSTGIHCQGSRATFRNCEVTGNLGPGFLVWSAGPVVIQCLIAWNSSEGVRCYEDGSPELRSTTIAWNRGVGILCEARSFPIIERSTIAGNTGSPGDSFRIGDTLGAGGILVLEGAAPIVTSSIIAGNEGTEIHLEPGGVADVRYSCVEGPEVWPGEGNLREDPLFCGFSDLSEVWVDPAAPGPGDGSQGSPYPSIDAALVFQLGLTEGSPCFGTGEGGIDMGSLSRDCEGRGPAKRLVHLAAGEYDISHLALPQGTSLAGAGSVHTILSGSLYGVGGDVHLSDLTVRNGKDGGVVVGAGASPTLSRLEIAGNADCGLICSEGSAPIVEDVRIIGNHGSGVRCRDGSRATFSRSEIRSNLEDGLRCSADGVVSLEDCTIVDNGGDGIALGRAQVIVRRCTISGNLEHGIAASYAAAEPSVLESSIVWDNLLGSSEFLEGAVLDVSYSALEGAEPPPGAGNIANDPLFEGWGTLAEAHVSAGALPGGDGSPEKPFSTLEEALDYRFSLSDGSPCLASGKDGIDMGAPQVPAGDGAGPSRRVILTPGTYEVGTRTLSHHASIEGADAETTIIRGRLTGLRTGATLSDLTGTGGIGHALLVGPGQAPRIRDCDFARSTGTGVICAEGSAPEFVRCRIAEILADGNGYGVECRGGSSPRFEDGSVTNVSGTGVLCSGTASIGRTMIAGNAGSGVNVGSGAAELWSLVIVGNSGDGIECWGSSPRVSGTTIFGNWGVGISCHYDSYDNEPSDPVVTNSILWRNREASVTLDEGWPDGAHPTIAYSALEGEEPWPGEGNTTEDPGFLDTGSFNWAFDSTAYRAISDAGRVIGYVPDYIVRRPDLHLAAGSSALDTGSLVGAPGTDFEGSARPCGSGIDMGAYESGPCLSVAFVRGDANADEVTNITDALYILEYLFRGGDDLPCRKAADSNDDGKLNVTDPIISLGYLFLGGPAPGRPFEACGPDPTADTLSCASFAACP